MKRFEHFPLEAKCILCDMNTDKPCCLVGIDGTSDDGIEEYIPIHVDCINLRWDKEIGLLYQRINKHENI